MAHRPKLLLSTLRLILSDMIVGGGRPVFVIVFGVYFMLHFMPSSDWFVWFVLFVSGVGVWHLTGLMRTTLDRAFARMLESDPEAGFKSAGATDILAEHLDAEAALEKSRRGMVWKFFGIGGATALASAWFYMLTPPGELPFGPGVLAAVTVVALWQAVRLLIAR